MYILDYILYKLYSVIDISILYNIHCYMIHINFMFRLKNSCTTNKALIFFHMCIYTFFICVYREMLHMFALIYTHIYMYKYTHKRTYVYRDIFYACVCVCNIYIYIYIYIYANFIKHNRHFMPTYFFLDPFEFPYYFYRIRGKLI